MAALLVALTTVWLTSTAEAGDDDRCARFAAGSAERAALVTGSGDETLVIGDSWSAGLGLAGAAVRLKDQIGSRVTIQLVEANPRLRRIQAEAAADVVAFDADADLVRVAEEGGRKARVSTGGTSHAHQCVRAQARARIHSPVQ